MDEKMLLVLVAETIRDADTELAEREDWHPEDFDITDDGL